MPSAPKQPGEPERLQKFLSAAGVASRRHAEAMIRQGRVTVNGEASHVGMRVGPDDVVRVDGVQVGEQAPRYLMLNKPTGVITSMEDERGRKSVGDLIAAAEEGAPRVYPVGRLDRDSAGLLLLTNDGELSHRLMHPSFGVEKTYHVMAEGRLTRQDAARLAAGVELEDGMTAPAEVKIVQAADERTLVEIIIHEGRNRQVRRMFEAVGHPVSKLVRVGYGPLVLGDVRPGAIRPLTNQEIRRLRKAAGLSQPRRRARAEEQPSNEAKPTARPSKAGKRRGKPGSKPGKATGSGKGRPAGSGRKPKKR